MAEIELTLNSPITEEQWDAITDVDFDKTDRIWFQTKHGKTVEFVKAEPPTTKAAPPTTNSDRIRAMSDDEMMEYMYHNCHCPPELDELPSCPYRKKNRVQTKDCRTCWLDWLKLEVWDGC